MAAAPGDSSVPDSIRHSICRAGFGGGGAAALGGTLIMKGVTLSHNSAIDGGAFEVAEQSGPSNNIPTQLNVTVSRRPSCRSHLQLETLSQETFPSHVGAAE